MVKISPVIQSCGILTGQKDKDHSTEIPALIQGIEITLHSETQNLQ